MNRYLVLTSRIKTELGYINHLDVIYNTTTPEKYTGVRFFTPKVIYKKPTKKLIIDLLTNSKSSNLGEWVDADIIRTLRGEVKNDKPNKKLFEIK